MLQCFPDKLTPRPAQIKAANFVAKAIGMGYRDIVIEMPTGGGKSLVAVTACRYGATCAQRRALTHHRRASRRARSARST